MSATRRYADADFSLRGLPPLARMGLRSYDSNPHIPFAPLNGRGCVVTIVRDKSRADPPPPIRLHPNLAEVYREEVEGLREALNSDDIRVDAASVLCGLIDEIRLIPVKGQLEIYLFGDLAAILDLCVNKNPGSIGTGVQVTLVAGTGFCSGLRPSLRLRNAPQARSLS